MDPHLRGYSSSFNGVHLSNQPLPILSHPNIVPRSQLDSNTVLDNSYREFDYPQPGLTPNSVASFSSVSQEEEDCDFSDVVLTYINQMLMEEDMEDKTCMLQDSLELQAAEKSLYEVLGKKYPPSPELIQDYAIQYGDCFSGTYSSCSSGAYFGDTTLIQGPDGCLSQFQSFPAYSISQSSYGSSTNTRVSSLGGLVDCPRSLLIPDFNTESQSVWQFKKGVEEASRFLPGETTLANGLVAQASKVETNGAAFKVKTKDEGECSTGGSRGRKNPYREDEDVEEERSSKLAAFSTESNLPSEMFDNVLLSSTGDGLEYMISVQEDLHNRMNKSLPLIGIAKGPNGGKGRGKKQSVKKEVVDLRTLLTSCAKAVAADDHRGANELLKKVRQHSSPFGDGTQRLAHCFANGLEARLAGTGSQIYRGLVSQRTSAADILKAYHLYLAASPFKRITNFVANKSIKRLVANATRLHVIDFGILYGFQWPTLIQRISWSKPGPPKVKITGIEFPQPGFRPAERVEETGRRLAAYAERFDVPFEYNAIAKKWETITIEDLKIDRDEVLVVNCIYRGKNLLDESVTVDSARDKVLDLIRRINPDLFIHGVVNGAFNAPFFVTRFREALFHFSSLFDMLETIVPREDRERMIIESEMFGREALNVIACEGWERVERPETYKQWQVRNLRAGLVQLPFDRDVVKMAAERVRTKYHKDFVIDEDGRWLLQGWKGRTVFALSVWKPALKT